MKLLMETHNKKLFPSQIRLQKNSVFGNLYNRSVFSEKNSGKSTAYKIQFITLRRL